MSLPTITLEKIRQPKDGNVLAYLTLDIGGLVQINDCRIVQGKSGPFLALPSRKGTDGKYYQYAGLSKELYDLAQGLAMDWVVQNGGVPVMDDF